MDDLISRRVLIDALHTWFRDGFDEDKWWNSTHVLAAIEGLPSAQQWYKWETCFDCPLSHGCPKIKGCTNEQANEYASQMPNDCPLSAQPDHVADISKKVADDDCISRREAIDALWKALYTYEDETERQFQESDELDVGDWIGHRIFVQNMNDIDRQTILNLPSAQPEQVCVTTVALTDEQVKEAVEKEKNAVISVIEPEPHWIPCSEKMPSETVIATVETKAFKHRYVCEAVWIPRWTWKASFDEWEDCSEYNEDDDEYYVLEGWYERVHNWDEYAYVAIDDDVIAWMSMPIPYCGVGNGE